MPTSQQVEDLLLSAEMQLATLVLNKTTKEANGCVGIEWNDAFRLYLDIQAVQRQYDSDDLTSDYFLKVWDCLNGVAGYNSTTSTLNPNYQIPNTNITIVQDATGNFIRIPFTADGVNPVTLNNFQAQYVPQFGDYAIVTIWVTQDGGNSYQQDTLTVPTITNLGGDINKPNDYEWFYPVPTVGYIQINGFNPARSQQTGVLPPISNPSSVLLSNAQLNALYGFAQWGQLVLLPNANARYEKLDNSPTGIWDYQLYNPNT